MPELISRHTNIERWLEVVVSSYLIVVVVVMDLMAQVQSHLLSQQYEGMMKKANLRGIGGGMR